MPPKQTSSAILVLLILALVGFLIYAAWRWVQRASPSPSAPLHSHRGSFQSPVSGYLPALLPVGWKPETEG